MNKEFTLYFAGSGGEELDTEMISLGCSRLFSQLNDKKHINRHLELLRGTSNKLFIDSGAYSAKNSNKKVVLDEYIRYLNTIGDDVTMFANLDVIPRTSDLEELRRCAEAGYDNFVRITENVSHPDKCVAVFHQGEPIDALDRYIRYYKDNKSLKFFGLGDVADIKGSDGKDSKRFVSTYCDYIKKELPYIKIHLFGYTRLDDLCSINCDSVDSTTWVKAAVYGKILTPYIQQLNVSEKRRFVGDSLHNINVIDRELIYNDILSKGFSIEEISNNVQARMRYNVLYLLDWVKNYRYVRLSKKNKLI